MAELEYSNEALEAKGLFYNKRITVYVEGNDDPLFWNNIFSLAEIEAHIEEVGGKNELIKYQNKILFEGADFFVATDNDNSEFMTDYLEHPNIIRTYGYSIENTLYYSYEPIQNTISNFCRKKLNLSADFNIWMSEFSKNVFDLIVYDIANNRFNKGISIFGDTCFRFLKSQKSHEICSTKTTEFIDSVKNHFTEGEIKEVIELIDQSEKDLWFLIKGHFITHALINLIKYHVRKQTGTQKVVTSDFLYSITLDLKENWKRRIDIKTVVDRIKEVTSNSI